MEENYTLHVGRNLFITNDLFLRRAQIDSLPIGVVLWSVHGEILDINAAAQRLLTDHVTAFMNFMQTPPWKLMFQNAIEGTPSGWQSFALKGENDPLNISFLPLYNFSNQIVGVINYLYPRGLRLESANALVNVSSNLEYASDYVRKLVETTETCAKDTHEIRNLLTTVRGYLQLFEKDVDDETQKHLQLAVDELDRAIELSRELLERIQRVQYRARTDLGALFDEIDRLIRQKAMDANMRVDFEIVGSTLTVRCDKDKLKQVLMNLIQNALEAVPSSGTIKIRADRYEPREAHLTQRDGEWVQILVCDNGPGIPESIQYRIFEPFFTTKESGTGLGLAISRQFIHEYGGELRLVQPDEIPADLRESGFAGAAFSIVLEGA